MTATATEKLALLGGTAVSSTPLTGPAWPPVSDACGQRLQEIYRSRAWSFNGPVEQAFSKEFAAAHDARFGVMMANGTVTLQTALGALGVGKGDEVIVPALTWMATVMAVRYVGAVPVFVDIEPHTYCMDPVQVQAAITSRTRAIIPVHLYGSMADLDAILAIAGKHKLAVIEDCAHGHGGQWAGKGLGSWGDVGSFSFQQSKTLASGEGGMCLTNDERLAERIYRAKHIGYAAGSAQGGAASGPPEDLLCHNFRATEFQAAILSDQLPGLAGLIQRYNDNAAVLERMLAHEPLVKVQARGRRSTRQNYYAFMVTFDPQRFAKVTHARLAEAAKAEGFPNLGGTYGPVVTHMLFNLPKSEYRIFGGRCPVTDDVVCPHTAGFLHTWLGADGATIEKIGLVLLKLARNADALAS